YDPAQTIVELLSGRTADLLTLDIDEDFPLASQSLTLLPDSLLASYLGIINVTAGISLRGGASIGVHTTLGLDTDGVYGDADGPNRQLFSLTGFVGVDLDLKGKLVVVDFAEVVGSAVVTASGGVDLVSPVPGQVKVHGDQMFHDGGIDT